MYFIACDTRENVGRKISSKSKISTINIYGKKKNEIPIFPLLSLKKKNKRQVNCLPQLVLQTVTKENSDRHKAF